MEFHELSYLNTGVSIISSPFSFSGLKLQQKSRRSNIISSKVANKTLLAKCAIILVAFMLLAVNNVAASGRKPSRNVAPIEYAELKNNDSIGFGTNVITSNNKQRIDPYYDDTLMYAHNANNYSGSLEADDDTHNNLTISNSPTISMKKKIDYDVLPDEFSHGDGAGDNNYTIIHSTYNGQYKHIINEDMNTFNESKFYNNEPENYPNEDLSHSYRSTTTR